MTGPITVLLADDDADFRSVYRRLFHGTPGFQLVSEASTGQEALQLMAEWTPDVALVDVQMPNGSGLDVVRGAEGLRTRIIVLTTFDLDEYVDEARWMGQGRWALCHYGSPRRTGLAVCQPAVHRPRKQIAKRFQLNLIV